MGNARNGRSGAAQSSRGRSVEPGAALRPAGLVEALAVVRRERAELEQREHDTCEDEHDKSDDDDREEGVHSDHAGPPFRKASRVRGAAPSDSDRDRLRENLELPEGATRASEPRVDRLALEREHAEAALVHAAERLAADEPLERLDAERELAHRERALRAEGAPAQALEV